MDRVIVADLSPRAWAVAIRLQPQNEGPTGQLDANLRTAVPDPPLPMKRAIFRPYDARAGQMATVSECRYRWLRAPATKHQQKPPARNAGGFCVEARRSRPSQPALSCRPFASKRPAEKCKSRGQASQAPEIINDVALYRTLRSGNPISTIVALIRLFSVRNAGLAFSIGRSTLAVVEFGRNANPCAIAAFASSCRPSRS